MLKRSKVNVCVSCILTNQQMIQFFFTEEIQEKYFKYLQNSKSFRIFKLNESYEVKSQSLTFTWKQNIVDKKALEIVLIVKVNISK